jgi:hypothetical protein
MGSNYYPMMGKSSPPSFAQRCRGSGVKGFRGPVDFFSIIKKITD